MAPKESSPSSGIYDAPRINPNPSGSQTQQKSLKKMAEENPTLIGDPVSLKAEKVESEPTPNDRGAASDVPAEKAPEEKPVKSKI